MRNPVIIPPAQQHLCLRIIPFFISLNEITSSICEPRRDILACPVRELPKIDENSTSTSISLKLSARSETHTTLKDGNGNPSIRSGTNHKVFTLVNLPHEAKLEPVSKGFAEQKLECLTVERKEE